MAADSSPSRSHTCLRPPQRPLRTLQFICPPFSFFHDELRVAETDPKSRRHRRPELLAPLEAGVILTWVRWIWPNTRSRAGTSPVCRHNRLNRNWRTLLCVAPSVYLLVQAEGA